MTININLLPRPKRKIRQVPVIFLLGISLFLSGSVFLIHQYQMTVASKKQLEQTLAEVKEKREKLQQTLIQANQAKAERPDVSTFSQFPEMVKKASVNTNFLFDQIAALLPDGSVVTTLEFTSPNKVKLGMSFATIEETVGFMQAVRKSPYFHLDHVGSVTESKLQVDMESLDPKEKPNLYVLSFDLSVKRNEPLP